MQRHSFHVLFMYANPISWHSPYRKICTYKFHQQSNLCKVFEKLRVQLTTLSNPKPNQSAHSVTHHMCSLGWSVGFSLRNQNGQPSWVASSTQTHSVHKPRCRIVFKKTVPRDTVFGSNAQPSNANNLIINVFGTGYKKSNIKTLSGYKLKMRIASPVSTSLVNNFCHQYQRHW